MKNATLMAIAIAALGSTLSLPAQALTMKECSVKYQAARQGGTLGGMTWNQFRKAQCGHDVSATPTAAPSPAPSPAAPTTTAAPRRAPAAPAAPTRRAARPTTTVPTATGRLVFPNAVAAQYANLAPGRARLLTCRDQYMTNKVNNANGGLRWIERGGGFWSECNRHLKGA